ncbi:MULTISPECIES: recombinase family protein [Parabacteroides]|uniref:recombinase family protein n=1 Tax=Parabacteroides timonensis TaxID=1871013 RepID=UPI00094EA818|nr:MULTISPECIES: recombinase family protein [Parabacteroides]
MVIAYLRVTIGKQHLETQKDEIERYAAANGFEVNKWITDIIDEKRKEKESSLSRIIDRMKQGDKVIITDIARFGRTLSEVMNLLGKCMAKGIHVCSINDRYILDDGLNTTVVSDTCNLISEIEHNLMSIRTKEALNHKKDKGLQLGRPKGTDAKQSLLDANKEEVMNMLERGDTVVMICKHFNVSRNTYYQFKRNYGL